MQSTIISETLDEHGASALDQQRGAKRRRAAHVVAKYFAVAGLAAAMVFGALFASYTAATNEHYMLVGADKTLSQETGAPVGALLVEHPVAPEHVKVGSLVTVVTGDGSGDFTGHVTSTFGTQLKDGTAEQVVDVASGHEVSSFVSDYSVNAIQPRAFTFDGYLLPIARNLAWVLASAAVGLAALITAIATKKTEQ